MYYTTTQLFSSEYRYLYKVALHFVLSSTVDVYK